MAVVVQCPLLGRMIKWECIQGKTFALLWTLLFKRWRNSDRKISFQSATEKRKSIHELKKSLFIHFLPRRSSPFTDLDSTSMIDESPSKEWSKTKMAWEEKKKKKERIKRKRKKKKKKKKEKRVDGSVNRLRRRGFWTGDQGRKNLASSLISNWSSWILFSCCGDKKREKPTEIYACTSKLHFLFRSLARSLHCTAHEA